MPNEKIDFANPTNMLLWTFTAAIGALTEGVRWESTGSVMRYSNSDIVPVEPQQFAGESHPLASLDEATRLIVISHIRTTTGSNVTFDVEMARLDNDADYVVVEAGIVPAATSGVIPSVAPNIHVAENVLPSSFLKTASSTAIGDDLWCRIAVDDPGLTGTVSDGFIMVMLVPAHTASQAVPHRGFNVSALAYR